MELPTLDNLRLASPCREKWREMEGDDRVRTCAKCEQRVYNFASMTRPEINALLLEKEGVLCVRLFYRADGTILTADCPEGRAERVRRFITVTKASVAIGVFAAAIALVSWMSTRTNDGSSRFDSWIQEKADPALKARRAKAEGERVRYTGKKSAPLFGHHE